MPQTPFDDTVYLPPVAAARAAARDRLVARLEAAGTPVLAQAVPGAAPPPATGGATVVWDLTAAVLGGGFEVVPEAHGGIAVWPLLPGLGDDPELWERGGAALAARGFATVQAVRPQLSAVDRRQLTDLAGDAAFDALFHREAAAEITFDRALHHLGVAPFFPRPLPRLPCTGRENRRLAGELALAAELWLRLGRSPAQGHALFRAAREADQTSYDLPALGRDGHLGLLAWLDEASRGVVEAGLAGERPALLGELLDEYLGTDP